MTPPSSGLSRCHCSGNCISIILDITAGIFTDLPPSKCLHQSHTKCASLQLVSVKFTFSHAVGSVSRIHTRANLFSKNAVESLSLAEMQLLYPCVHQQFQPRVEQKHRSLVILKYLARVRTYEVAAKVRIGTLSSFLLWRKGVLFDAGKHTALASARFPTT